MKIGIITAMSSEYKQVAQLMEEKKEHTEGIYSYTEGKIKNNTLILTQCGIGKVNAAAGAVELIRNFQPDCIISTGVAGGIDKCLKVMDVVASSHIVYHDVWCGEGNEYGQIQGLPDRFAGDKVLIEKVLKANEGKRVYGGLICSGDKFITDRKELEAIKARFPEGMACDMESGAIAQVCHICHIPFISMRIISDTPGVDDHWEQYTNFWEAAPQQSFAILRNTIENL